MVRWATGPQCSRENRNVLSPSRCRECMLTGRSVSDKLLHRAPARGPGDGGYFHARAVAETAECSVERDRGERSRQMGNQSPPNSKPHSPFKARAGSSGFHLFNRLTGLNILLDELPYAPYRVVWLLLDRYRSCAHERM